MLGNKMHGNPNTRLMGNKSYVSFPMGNKYYGRFNDQMKIEALPNHHSDIFNHLSNSNIVHRMPMTYRDQVRPKAFH
jgi:hypothetical protein